METLPSIRASDADREDVAARLRHAAVEGRLSADELEERLETLYGSRTYGELDALVADLPLSHSPARPRVRIGRWAAAVAAITLVLAMLGARVVSRAHSAVAVSPYGHIRYRFPDPLANAGHGLVEAASLVGVLALVLACTALICWVLVRARSRSDV